MNRTFHLSKFPSAVLPSTGDATALGSYLYFIITAILYNSQYFNFKNNYSIDTNIKK